jgi:hypothetical protein
LKSPGPGRVLVQEIAFRLTAARDEHAVHAVHPARHLVTALAVTVDVESQQRFQLGKDLSIGVEAEAQSRRKHVVLRSMTEPPPAGQLGGDGHQYDERKEHPEEIHDS